MEIHVVAGSDDGYACALAVMVRSLLERVSADAHPVLHILDCGIGAPMKERILASWQELRKSVDWIAVDVSHLPHLPAAGHLNRASLARLLMAEFLPKGLASAIYLDADMLVTGDLAEVFRLPRPGRAISAVQSAAMPFNDAARALPAGHPALPRIGRLRPLDLLAPEGLPPGVEPLGKYFNSGVLLLDLEAWRAEEIGPRAVRFTVEHAGKLRYGDQDTLNVLASGRWAELPLHWNQQVSIHTRYPSGAESPFDPAEFDRVRDRPSIVHFSGRKKPWRTRYDHPWTAAYLEVMRRTPWWKQAVFMQWKSSRLAGAVRAVEGLFRRRRKRRKAEEAQEEP